MVFPSVCTGAKLTSLYIVWTLSPRVGIWDLSPGWPQQGDWFFPLPHPPWKPSHMEGFGQWEDLSHSQTYYEEVIVSLMCTRLLYHKLTNTLKHLKWLMQIDIHTSQNHWVGLVGNVGTGESGIGRLDVLWHRGRGLNMSLTWFHCFHHSVLLCALNQMVFQCPVDSLSWCATRRMGEVPVI